MRLYDGLCGRGLTNTAQSTHWSHRPSQLKVQKEKYVYNISKECNQKAVVVPMRPSLLPAPANSTRRVAPLGQKRVGY